MLGDLATEKMGSFSYMRRANVKQEALTRPIQCFVVLLSGLHIWKFLCLTASRLRWGKYYTRPSME